MKYDIFVSYRRTSFESANLIAEKLRSMGYSVFFDVETLRSGKFNEQLFEVIEQSNDFVLVLPPNALDRCEDENDWVRKEVMHAMLHKKNIIPVMLSGFEWPSPMPDGMEDLSNYQAITAGEREFFDMSMKRLAGYLKSKPHRNMRQFYKKAGVLLLTVLVLVGIGVFAVRQTMIPLCKNVASNLTLGMSIVDLLKNEPEEVMGHWEHFIRTYDLCKTEEQRDIISKQFSATLEKLTEQAKQLHQQFARLPEFSSKDATLLGYYDVPTQEIESFYGTFDMIFSEHLNSLSQIHQFYDNESLKKDKEDLYFRKEFTRLGFEMNSLMADVLYYGYMEVLSKLPSSAQKEYITRSTNWSKLPTDVGLGKSVEEYRQYQESTINEIQKVMSQMERSASEYKGRVEAQIESSTNR